MCCEVKLPNIIVNKIKELGVDVESFILDLLIRELKLDPLEEIEVHLELAKKFFSEGIELISKDPIQASEKLYKVVEECVKALVLKYNFKEIIEVVEKRGRWKVDDLFNAISKLRKILGDDVRRWWDSAWNLHVWGFHEAKATKEYVEERIEDIKKFLELTERVIRST